MACTRMASVCLVCMALVVGTCSAGFAAEAGASGAALTAVPAPSPAQTTSADGAKKVLPPVPVVASSSPILRAPQPASPVPLMPPVPTDPRVAELTQKYRDLDRQIVNLVQEGRKTKDTA